MGTVGNVIYDFIEKLYPLCRGISGEGTRETLRLIKDVIPITIVSHPTGFKVFDWVIPDEWSINDAYVEDPGGNKIVDFCDSNLSVLHHSQPV